ncbi:hypothetical protein AVEN_38061-1 [Araneus ventricosus]|uniref:Uncharacterized protein n=1 Tax=Araneus ventricosus TaxID=182803 RepID=A0A4Y2IYP0_ARAVE|nr:hypothetical protein AVEN_38061-1 [Araneus ventricosus]
MSVNSVINLFSFIGGRQFLRKRQIFPITTKFLFRRIHWRKSGHFENPDISPDVSVESRLSGRMVTLLILFSKGFLDKGCQAMSHMSAFPGFFVRSRSVKCKHHPSILHFLPILMKITSSCACAKARRDSESVAKQYLLFTRINPKMSGPTVKIPIRSWELRDLPSQMRGGIGAFFFEDGKGQERFRCCRRKEDSQNYSG